MNIKQFSLKIGLISVLLLAGCKSEKEKMLSIGDEKFFAGDFKGAAKVYEEAKTKYPDYINAYIRLADCELCLSQQHFTFIVKLDYAKAADKQFGMYLNKYTYTANKELISFNEEERREKLLSYSNEIEFLSDAISQNENNYIFNFARGMWFYVLEMPEKAIEDFEKAIKKNTNSLESRLMIARVYSRYFRGFGRSASYGDMRNSYKAIRIYMDILKSNQGYKVLSETAACLNFVGQPKMALELLNSAYEKDTSNIALLSDLAQYNEINGNLLEAAKQLRQLYQKRPQDSFYLERLAWTLNILGDNKGSLETFKKVYEQVKMKNKDDSIRLRWAIDNYSVNYNKTKYKK